MLVKYLDINHRIDSNHILAHSLVYSMVAYLRPLYFYKIFASRNSHLTRTFQNERSMHMVECEHPKTISIDRVNSIFQLMTSKKLPQKVQDCSTWVQWWNRVLNKTKLSDLVVELIATCSGNDLRSL